MLKLLLHTGSCGRIVQIIPVGITTHAEFTFLFVEFYIMSSQKNTGAEHRLGMSHGLEPDGQLQVGPGGTPNLPPISALAPVIYVPEIIHGSDYMDVPEDNRGSEGRGLPRIPVVEMNGNTPKGFGEEIPPGATRERVAEIIARQEALHGEADRLARSEFGTPGRMEAAIAAQALRQDIYRLMAHSDSLPETIVNPSTNRLPFGRLLGGLAAKLLFNRRGNL